MNLPVIAFVYSSSLMKKKKRYVSLLCLKKAENKQFPFPFCFKIHWGKKQNKKKWKGKNVTFKETKK